MLGLGARSLRGESLKDLIHTRKVGTADAAGGAQAKVASVSLIYTLDAGEVPGAAAGDELVFARRITIGGASAYSVDGIDMTAAKYKASLERINVYTEARNFLVFQGDVESVANKPPEDMLKYFEVFSGSAEWKYV